MLTMPITAIKKAIDIKVAAEKAAYKRSEAGKAAQKRYTQSDKGKANNKRGSKKYLATINGYLRHLYSSMKQRCENPNDTGYKCYGGRGIEVRFTADEFVDYVVNVLRQDPRGLTIDRIDSDGHYEPGNIWFCTMAQNVEYRGKDHFGGLV